MVFAFAHYVRLVLLKYIVLIVFVNKHDYFVSSTRHTMSLWCVDTGVDKQTSLKCLVRAPRSGTAGLNRRIALAHIL